MKVVIFSTCIVDLFFPNVGAAMVEVLERLAVKPSCRLSRFVAANRHIIQVT